LKKKTDKKTRANFGDVLPRPMVEPLAFDLGYQSKDPRNLCLFGLAGGAGTLQMFGQGLQAMIHPLFPGMADPDEEIIWGPLGWADKLGGHNSDQPQQNRGGSGWK